MSKISTTARQLIFFAGAFASASVMITASTASAQARDTYFRAELAQPVEAGTEVIRGVVWYCDGTVCEAPKATARPANVCEGLQNKKGEVAAFSWRDRDFDDADMAACND